MRSRSRCKLWLLLGLLAAGCTKPAANTFGFSVGQFPIQITAENLRVRAENKWLSGKNAECAPCHQTVYDNWQQSRHRVAFTNELYHDSHAREPSAWCVNCHAPFAEPGANPLDLAKRVQSDDGVSCNVCHVRAGKVITSKIPQPQKGMPAHDYVAEPQMATATFCESCHEFNFPSADSKPAAGREFRYSDLPMQSTHSEWKTSGFAHSPCQNCHLFGESPQSHRFPGGHDAKNLQQALKLECERSEDGKLRVRLYTLGVGHAFPTGDLFRTLRISLYAGKTLITELKLGKRFDNQTVPPGEMHRPNKFLAEDSTIPAPVQGEFVSLKDYLIEWPQASHQVRYAMRLDYLHPHNALVSHLKSPLTGIDIRTGEIAIKPAGSKKSKG